MMLAVDWITELSAFALLAAEWDALVASTASPFNLHSWYMLWWRAFAGDDDLRVCTVRRDGHLTAALPLVADGTRLRGMVNGHSGHLQALYSDPESLRALTDAVFERRCPEVELKAIPTDDPTLASLLASASSAGRLAIPEPGYSSPIVDTSGDFDEWRAEHRSWKGRIARYRRKIEREHETEIELVVAPDDLDAWLDQGFALEASGWKGETRTAIESNPDTAGFYREMARALHERDELRLSRINLDGRMVAFSFCLLRGGRLYSLKVGYDETLKKVVPGLVLQLAIVERCFELGLDAYELLGEDNDWKRKISSSNREHTVLRAYPRTPPGVSRYCYRKRLRPPLKHAYRRVRPRTRASK